MAQMKLGNMEVYMSKKIYFIIVLVLLFLSSCTRQTQPKIDEEAISKDINKEIESPDSTDTTPKYTGEIITDGNYNNAVVFVPDMETKEYIKNNHSFNFDEGLYLTYDNKDIVRDLPASLGIYKVEIEPNIEESDYYMKVKSIKLTDKIGTIEYEGKEYKTNNLDENVRIKDRINGLIVSYVNFTDNKEGVIIRFAGQLEVEGTYTLYNGGEYYNNINVGKIFANEESLKNFPVYNNGPVKANKFSVFLSETNDLYKKLADNSSIGKGKFRISNYYLTGGYLGTEFTPSEKLEEIISLDQDYKGMFEFSKDYLYSLIVSTEKYDLIFQSYHDYDKLYDGNYYVIEKKNNNKIHILSAEGFYYNYEETNDERYKNYDMFVLESDGYNNKTNTQIGKHSIVLRINDGTVIKELDYADFKDGDKTKTIYEGQEFSGMKAEDIKILYYCHEDDELVRIQVQFSGEVTVTGTLSLSIDDSQYSYFANFICDEEGAKNLPYPAADTRDVWFSIANEDVKELLGKEAFEKKCKLKIKNYFINFSATDARNTAEIVSIEELKE